jgi:NADH-quinone oxidoreductase subunit E
MACHCEFEEVDLAPLDRIIDGYKGKKGALIPILQRAQEHYGYLPRPVIRHIAKRTKTPPNRVFGVVTFYSQFYLNRRGKYIVRQCDGTACHIRGSGKIIDSVERELGIKVGETTPDYKVTYEVVYCLGSCGLAPVAVVNDKFVGRIGVDDMPRVIRELP